ncbi:hypothetical protein PINS_up021218 [Pythium insidiosum]|nr:hypothetical protein PINS_up021218 [Pythium insidiosum]
MHDGDVVLCWVTARGVVEDASVRVRLSVGATHGSVVLGASGVALGRALAVMRDGDVLLRGVATCGVVEDASVRVRLSVGATHGSVVLGASGVALGRTLAVMRDGDVLLRGVAARGVVEDASVRVRLSVGATHGSVVLGAARVALLVRCVVGGCRRRRTLAVLLQDDAGVVAVRDAEHARVAVGDTVGSADRRVVLCAHDVVAVVSVGRCG